MSKNLIIGLVAAVLVAGGGWYFYSNTGGAGDAMMMKGNEEKSAMGSMKDLLARGSSECTVSNKVENSESTGTVFVGNGKMRGDFKTVTVNPAMTMESHMISDGEYIYTWSDAMPQGMKISVAASNGAQAQAPQGQAQDLYNAQVNYDCDSWRVDESKFVVPTNVEFMDLSSMMQGAGTLAPPTQGAMNPPSKSQQCGMCDQAPEPQRSQCRAALQCR